MTPKDDLDHFQMLWEAHAELVGLKSEFALLRADIEAWIAERDQAEFKATILEAQIGGWEAACALQVAVLRDALTYLRYNVAETAHVASLIARIEKATETSAGTGLLTDLEAAYHALMSYACGNSAPDPAEEMAAIIGKRIGKVRDE